MVDVQGAVPGTGDEHGVLGRVDEGFDGFVMRAQHGLFTGGEVNSVVKGTQRLVYEERRVFLLTSERPCRDLQRKLHYRPCQSRHQELGRGAQLWP